MWWRKSKQEEVASAVTKQFWKQKFVSKNPWKKIANHTEDHSNSNNRDVAGERMTGIPVSQMGATDIERVLKDMGHCLQTRGYRSR